MEQVNEMIAAEPFSVTIAHVFPLHQAMAAQQALEEHRVGKIILEVAP